jgi:predicted RNA-binding protein YlqC (UPF0109 family)
MNDFVKFLITPLLSQKDELEIIASGSVVTVKISKEDMGRVIGKHGTIISALRNLVKTYCSIQNLPPMSVNLQEE